MNNIKTIVERLKENEETAKKFHTVETQILSILNYTDFFEVLLTKIKETFNIPFVWCTFQETVEVSYLLQHMRSSIILKKNIKIINKDSFMKLVGSNTKPTLINDNLKDYYSLFPKSITHHHVRSMVIAPVSLDGEIIGSLNHADLSPQRFQPGIDTNLLEQLAAKVSIGLSNVTAHEKLKFLIYHDPLTKLLSRRVMEKALKREFVRTLRYKSILSVIFLEIDNFKRTNDNFGHAIGEKLLKYIADKLSYYSRESDIVARLKGDKFVFILPETTAYNAKKIVTRLRIYFIEHPFRIQEKTIPSSISFGISSTEDNDIKDPGRLLEKAEENLYCIKQKILIDNKKTGDNNLIALPVSRKARGERKK